MQEKMQHYLRDNTFLEAFAELTNEEAIELRDAYNRKDLSVTAIIVMKAKWSKYTFSPHCSMCLIEARHIAEAVIHFRENPQNYGY